MKSPYQNLHVNYHGLFLSPMSWAQVNREMVLAMDRLGCRVSVVANRGFCYQPDFPVQERISRLREEPLSSQWDVALEYPLNYARFNAKYKAGLLVYESTKLPSRWVREILKYLDLLVVPSSFCERAAERSGVPAERIVVIPYGFDPLRYWPSPEASAWMDLSKRRFTFLCVTMPHLRKGVRELIQAFQEEFTLEEPVQLILKFPYRLENRRRRSPWELESIETFSRVDPSGAETNRNIHLFHDPFPPEQMPFWYALCDAYVQPSYGEGFGLSILEAKAVGKPTLVTGWGGHMDFCNEENSYLIDYELIPAGRAQYDSKDQDALFARPLIDSLRKQMRRVFLHPGEAGARVDRSLRDIRQLTWEACARKLIGTLLERM